MSGTGRFITCRLATRAPGAARLPAAVPAACPVPGPRRTGRQLPFTPARTSGEAIIIGRADPGDLRAEAASSIAVLDGRRYSATVTVAAVTLRDDPARFTVR
jgi:hypothetical protein